MSQAPSITAEDAVQLAQKAIQKANENEKEIATLREENENLRQCIQELKAAQPDTSDYENLDRDDKVGLVRQHLYKKATDSNGKAKVDYKDVRWSVFDGEPSPDHCYTLMQQAATEAGFEMNDPDTGNKRLTVNTARTNTEGGFSHANKDR